MLKRKIMDRLAEWKDTSSRKALLVTGARQTGKTYTVRAFAKERYESVVEVNFLADDQAASFLSKVSGAEELVSRLTLLAGKEVVPGNTLVFFDEVQESLEIVTLSKFLVEDGRFDVVLSGSLLGVELQGVRSFPVGYLHRERMYPLDFEEFCWSQGVPDAILDEVRACYERRVPVEESLHKRLVRLYRFYLAIGGMPEAVQRYIDSSRDLSAARAVASDIVELYREDIAKYARRRSLQIKTIFDNIPRQLAKENKRFQLKSLSEGATFERYDDDFAWLVDAGVALPTNLVTEPKFPLGRTMRVDRFKLYSSDVGLLLSQYPRKVAIDVIAGSRSVNFGSVYENVVAQELTAAQFGLFYYHNNRKGEVDFLLETDFGEIVPIEVKSGKDYKIHTALNNLLGTPECGIEYAYVLSEGNVSQGRRAGKAVYYLPIYMTFCFLRNSRNDLSDIKSDFPSFDDWND